MSDDGPRIFGSYANEHSRFRPGYPSALWDWGIPEDATVVVDLGCGSGHASPAPEAVIYLNRLSDLLFMQARTANASADVADVPWISPQAE